MLIVDCLKANIPYYGHFCVVALVTTSLYYVTYFAWLRSTLLGACCSTIVTYNMQVPVYIATSVAHQYHSRCDHLPYTGGYGTGRGHHHSAAFSRPEVAKVACGQFLHGLISRSLVLASASYRDPLTIPWLQECYICLVTKYAMPLFVPL